MIKLDPRLILCWAISCWTRLLICSPVSILLNVSQDSTSPLHRFSYSAVITIHIYRITPLRLGSSISNQIAALLLELRLNPFDLLFCSTAAQLQVCISMTITPIQLLEEMFIYMSPKVLILWWSRQVHVHVVSFLNRPTRLCSPLPRLTSLSTMSLHS